MFNKLTRLLLASCALMVPFMASATPVTVDFTITATHGYDGSNFNASNYAGYASGTVGTGSFTFDDALGSFSDPSVGRPLIDFGFSWLGASFNEASSLLFRLSLNSENELTAWGIGQPIGSCAAITCVSSVGPSDFWLNSGGGDTAGVVHLEGTTGWMHGSIDWSVRPVSVPEPTSLVLLSLGLLSFGAMRLRRR